MIGFIDSAKTCGAVPVTNASTPVVAAFAGRQEITIVNDDATNAVYLALSTTPKVAPTALINSGIRLNAGGGSWTSNVYRGAVSAITVSGSAVVTVTDI